METLSCLKRSPKFHSTVPNLSMNLSKIILLFTTWFVYCSFFQRFFSILEYEFKCLLVCLSEIEFTYMCAINNRATISLYVATKMKQLNTTLFTVPVSRILGRSIFPKDQVYPTHFTVTQYNSATPAQTFIWHLVKGQGPMYHWLTKRINKIY